MRETASRARWQDVKRIFREALDRHAAERLAFLERACGDDEALRGEVEALLAADLESSVPAATAAIVTGIEIAIDRVAFDERYAPGTRVGPYRILDRVPAWRGVSAHLALRL